MAKYLINYLEQKSKINKNIYGHFCEHLGHLIYDGIFVGKDSHIPNLNGVRLDVIEALKEIKVPILRWPGGCFADTYHWKDAVGPQEKRKPIANRYWGGTLEDNSFGTDEFMTLCEELGCDAYLGGNLGTGSIQEMIDWVEYLCEDLDTPMAKWRKANGREKSYKLAAFGIGNEAWGGGGQMKADYYGSLFRQSAHFISNAMGTGISSSLNGFSKDKTLMIASGPNADDYAYTELLMKTLTDKTFMLNAASGQFIADGISLHYYSYPVPMNSESSFEKMKTADDFNEDGWYCLLSAGARMEELITQHDHIMSQYDPKKKMGLMVDEWGSWYKTEPGTNPSFLFQQNTMRDAILAALSLNIFNKHSDRVHLTTIAQMVNVLQSIILTDGKQMILTPTYHVYNMYKEHQDATLLGSYIQNEYVGVKDFLINKIFESASIDQDGNVLCTLCNTSLEESETIEAMLYGTNIQSASAQILCEDPHAKNTFQDPGKVNIKDYSMEVSSEGFKLNLPPASVVSVKIIVQ